MKAIVYTHYGSPDVLELKEVEKPTPKDDEVLVRVHAAGLHIGDRYAVRGVPFAMRLATGLRKPKHGIPGFDVAGRVVAVGTTVQHFQQGDEVLKPMLGNAVME